MKEFHVFDQIYEKTMGLSVVTPVEVSKSDEQKIMDGSLVVPDRVAFIGLGAMGFGMASWLVHEKYTVCGYDVSDEQGASWLYMTFYLPSWMVLLLCFQVSYIA